MCRREILFCDDRHFGISRSPQFEGWTDLEFCEWMIREIGVAAVPGSSFFREPVNHLIRMHFARGTDVLDEAIRRLEKLSELLK